MEMMVVLLIMSIIAAATAPIVSRKMTRSAGSNASPWVFTGQGKNIAFNMGGLDNATAIIGAAKVPDGTKTRLYIDCGEQASQITLGSGDLAASILADPVNERVGIYSATSGTNVPNGSISIGMGQSIGSTNNIIIGNNSSSTKNDAIVIGNNSKTSLQDAIAIGHNTSSSAAGVAIGNRAQSTTGAIAIGSAAGTENSTKASGGFSIAIGSQSVASNTSSIAIGFGSKVDAASSVGIGSGISINNEDTNTVAVGNLAKAHKEYAVAIGASSIASGKDSIAIGRAQAIQNAENQIAIGHVAAAYANNSIAIGDNAYAFNLNSIAIGNHAKASNNNSVAIGSNASATQANQIVLGTANDTVYIPGKLVVDWDTALGAQTGSRVFVRTWSGWSGGNKLSFMEFDTGNRQVKVRGDEWENNYTTSFSGGYVHYSDKRLKNLGENFTAGLNELKKLDFYHYTFKKDKSKTPHVGVMAQDLQKVFPDAVAKGDDGYLRIRFEDMFYAVINAVKELDAKITSILSKNDEQDKSIEEQKAKIETQGKTIESQQKLIEAQQKTIEELQKQLDKQNEVFSKRLNKLEGREG